MSFRFIEAEKANFTIAAMCRFLRVTRSGFYAWRNPVESARWLRDRKLLLAIRCSFYESRCTYGSPRIHRELLASGERVSRKRVARLRRESGLEVRRKKRFRRPTDSRHELPVAASELARKFEPGGMRAWRVGDVTFIWALEGWLCLATLLDLTTGRVVGWSMSSRNDTALVLAAFEMALARTGAPPVEHHSDRGVTYASTGCRRQLASLQITCSMSRRGNCWDNAVAESFFSTLKLEWLDHHRFLTRAQSRAAAFDFIQTFHNRQLRHSSLGYLSPEAYARQLNTA